MVHANLAKNAKTRSYDYGSHRSHESHEGCIAEGSQLSALPSVSSRMVHTSDSDVCFCEIREICVRQKKISVRENKNT